MDSAPRDAPSPAREAASLAWVAARLVGTTSILVPLLVLFESLHWVFARLLVPLAPPAAAGLYMMAIATVEVGVVAGGRIRLSTLR